MKLPQEAISRKIIETRRAALQALGEPTDVDRCPTCMKKAREPWRHFSSHSEIQNGCVDAHHTAEMESVRRCFGTNTLTVQWHFRPEALRVRQGWFEMLADIEGYAAAE